MKIPRVCIAAGSSGAGKTTFCCGLLKALINRGLRPAAFKCGPDYIDPLFHREVLGAHSSNLDLFLLDETALAALLRENMEGKDIAVMEGVMGFYDGLGGASTSASTWHIASVTRSPVILVEDCAASSLTAVSRIQGMARFREQSMIAGVVLNNCGERLFMELKAVIETETALRVYGFLPRMKNCRIESRHLGLVTPAEIESLREKINAVAAQIEKSVDVDGIIELGNREPEIEIKAGHKAAAVKTNNRGTAQGIEAVSCLCRRFTAAKADTSGKPGPAPAVGGERDAPIESKLNNNLNPGPIRVAVARDTAFCFYYEDALNLLRRMGADIVFFSPLGDRRLPGNIGGIYLGGGYPELYGRALSENTAMLDDLRAAVKGGTPTIAECGGFMYLHEELVDKAGAGHQMCGVLPGACRPSPALVRFGYAEYTALGDNLLCEAGECLRGHEFHYWESDYPGESFRARKPSGGGEWTAITATETLFAGFPHFHWYAYPAMLERFLRRRENNG